jgi:hypothetical protein
MRVGRRQFVEASEKYSRAVWVGSIQDCGGYHRGTNRTTRGELTVADFKLQNDDPRPEPWKPEKREKPRQAVLFSGMDLLAGQMDLFQTDGEEEEGDDGAN